MVYLIVGVSCVVAKAQYFCPATLKISFFGLQPIQKYSEPFAVENITAIYVTYREGLKYGKFHAGNSFKISARPKIILILYLFSPLFSNQLFFQLQTRCRMELRPLQNFRDLYKVVISHERPKGSMIGFGLLLLSSFDFDFRRPPVRTSYITI